VLQLYFIQAPARLRHYAEASGRLLLRQWQGVLLCGLLVAGQATTVLMLPATLLAGLARSGNAGGAVLLAGLAALWIVPQRRQVRGSQMAGYAATLPVPRPVRLLLDLTVLLLADALGVLELVLAASVGGMSALPGLAALLMLVLAVQLAVLHLALPDPRRMLRRLPLPGGLRTNLQALAEQPASSGARLLVTVTIAAGAAALATAFQFDVRALPVAVVALALSGFVLADFYRVLNAAHAPIRAYLATLPLGRHTLLLRDMATVLLLGSVPFLMLTVWFGVFDPASLFAFGLLALAYAGLLALLRLPMLGAGGLGAMLAALMAAGWAGSAIAMVLK
jgi:hypothetical protein